MKKCPRCGAAHNVLVCPSEDPERAFVISKKTCEEEWTEDAESLADPDRCYEVRKNKAPEVKKGKRIPTEEVKAALRELVTEQRGSNKEDDRAAFMQSARFDQVRFIIEIQTHEDHMQEEYSSSESFIHSFIFTFS